MTHLSSEAKLMRCESFVVDRRDLRHTTVIAGEIEALKAGEVLLRIDRFALTANNVTYAEMGDRFHYWSFFRAPEGWGSVPAWGFADVIQSTHADIPIRERIYGFFPMSTHVVMRPDRIRPGSFIDASEHRLSLPAAYNLYLRCAGDPEYRVRDEAHQALLRPVFITSFMLDDMLADEAFYGAHQVVLSSASSKVAIGLAHLLHARSRVRVTGLTSASNRELVSQLGSYDEVFLYDEIERLPVQPSVYVDFAGSATVRHDVHARLGDRLRFSSAVGFSHRDRGRAPAAPSDVPVTPFFAPDRLRKRAKDWGHAILSGRIAEQWPAFVEMSRRWLTVSERQGLAELERTWFEALDGRVPPDIGCMVTLPEREHAG